MSADRHAPGRDIADRLRAEHFEAGDALGWFDALYREAGEDPARVPWAHEFPRKELTDWLARRPEERCKGRALDVGCGIGDNAAALAEAGFDVSAFDISPAAIAWAARRFPDLAITWASANLLDPPPEWREAFDLVNETYTLQALRGEHRTRGLAAIASFVAPGGALLVICRARLEDELPEGPPWPLARSELEPLKAHGLEEIRFEEFFVEKDHPTRHFRAEYQRL